MSNNRLEIFLIVFLLLVFACNPSTSGPQILLDTAVPSSPGSQDFLYLSSEYLDDRIEFLKISEDGVVQSPFHPLPIHYPMESLPDQEITILNYCVRSGDCSIEQMDFRYWRGSLNLSPDKNTLAWIDGALDCTLPTNYCLGGVSRLALWDINRRESRILLEIPSHIDLTAKQSIRNLQWSPSSQKLGYIHWSHQYGWERLRVIDIKTGQIETIGEEVSAFKWSPIQDQLAYITKTDSAEVVKVNASDGSPLLIIDDGWEKVADIAWSPNGEDLALVTTSADGSPRLNVINLAQATIQPIDIPSEKNSRYTAIRWSPDGKRIAILGEQASPDDPLQMHIVNLMSGNVVSLLNKLGTPIRYQGSLDAKFEWSPDGRTIAITKVISDSRINRGVFLIDADNARVISEMELEGVSPNWMWSKTKNAILISRTSHSETCGDRIVEIGIIDWENNVYKKIAFNSYLQQDLDECKIDLGEPIW